MDLIGNPSSTKIREWAMKYKELEEVIDYLSRKYSHQKENPYAEDRFIPEEVF